MKKNTCYVRDELIFLNPRPNEISQIILLVNEPHFSQNNKYSFRGARPCHGAVVLPATWNVDFALVEGGQKEYFNARIILRWTWCSNFNVTI